MKLIRYCYATILLLLTLTASISLAAVNDGLADCFPKIGNEREVIRDEKTGRPITFLTGPEHMDTVYYPTARSWTRNGRYVLLESDRPRPDGTIHPGERQLLAAEVETGDLYWLASLEVEDTELYGDAHQRMSSQYHADYAPGAHSIVYYDMTGHRAFYLDLGNGKKTQILHMKDGTIGDPPSISTDGARVIFYAAHPGPRAGDHFIGSTFAIYSLDIDLQTGQPAGSPQLLTAYPGRKGRDYKKDARDLIIVNHCQINPTDKDRVGYAHQVSRSVSDGTIQEARIWEISVSDPYGKPVLITPARRWHTHEVWGPKGTFFYFIDTGQVARVDTHTGKMETLAKGLEPRAWHLTVSPDAKTVVTDTFAGYGGPRDGLDLHGILKVDVESGKHELLAVQPGHRSHPRHPHPNFSPRGDKVAFVVAAHKENARLAVVDIP